MEGPRDRHTTYRSRAPLVGCHRSESQQARAAVWEQSFQGGEVLVFEHHLLVSVWFLRLNGFENIYFRRGKSP